MLSINFGELLEIEEIIVVVSIVLFGSVFS